MTLVNALVALVAAPLVAASLTPAAADVPLVPIGNIQTFRRADATVPMPTNFVIEGQIVASAGRRAVLSDGTASIRIFPLPAPDDETSEDWRVGDIVRVTCDQLPSPLTPNADVIHARSVTVLRHHQPQPPVATDVAHILAGEVDFSSVTTEGVITDVFRDEVDPIFIYFTLSSLNDNLLLTLRDPSTNTFLSAHNLLDCAVSVRGLCVPLDDGLRHYMGRRIELGGLDSIRPIDGQEDAANATTPSPLPSIRDTITLPPRKFPHRFTVRGHIIARWNTKNALLSTDDGRCLRLHLAEGAVPSPGARVKVDGFLRTNAFFAHLYNATVEEIPGEASLNKSPRTISPRAVLFDDEGRARIDSRFDGRIVRMEGLVRDTLQSQADDGRCILEADGIRLTVLLGDLPLPATGSRVSVAGACLITTDSESSGIVRLDGFCLVARNRDDLVILEGPPWWTPARFLFLIGLLGAVILGFFLWNRLLQRLVERRGRALLKEEVRTLAAGLKLDERTRLAVELHDSVAQSLTAIALQLGLTDRLIGTNDGAAHERLAIATRMLDSCHGEIRACIWDLRNLALDEHDMNEAIRRTVAPYLGGAALLVRFAVPRSRLSDKTTHTILRIIRELVTNAIRHGQARQIRVAGALDNQTIRFSVTDDGHGFDPDAHPGPADGHFGLQGIRERIRRDKGKMTIDSSPGSGTRISISIELHEGNSPVRPPKESNP